MNLKTYRLFLSKPLLKCVFTFLAFNLIGGPLVHAAELRGAYGHSVPAENPYDIRGVKAKLDYLNRSPELIIEIDKISDSLDANAPKSFRIDLDLFKLDVLSKIGDFEDAADLAAKIYMTHHRNSFLSDKEYGDTMYQIVESLAKTDNLGISYDIIQKLRMSIYEQPDAYLSFIIDKSLIEVYIETSDYKRALELALSVLDNPNYMSIDEIRKWRPVAINEIAYLFNRLGDGKNALLYLNEAAQILETRSLPDAKLSKAQALNFANRGRAYLLLGNYDQARQMGINVGNANKDLRQDYLTAVSHRLIGSSDYHQGLYIRASKELKAGIVIAETDNNLSLRRSLYKDYISTLEKLGQNKSATKWYKKLFELENQWQETLSATRSKLNDVEFSAFKNHQDMVNLHQELGRNKSITKMMLIAIFSLLSGAGVLLYLLYYMRKIQKELILSEMKAQAANHAKSDFLANMSHEIRTPMNGVLGMTQLLERTPLSSQQRDYLDIVKQSGTTLLDLINDILDFSKIEADKLTLNYAPCNLDQTLLGVVNLLMPNAHEKSIGITYRWNPNVPKYFMLDSKRIRQVVMNLVGNAIKFTPEGLVHISAEAQLKDGHAQIQISVSDTGIGIESNQLDVIFEKFTQAGEGSNRIPGGTGLGLAISHKLTEAMHGKLSVVSKLGQGSTFTLNIPAEMVGSESIPQSLPKPSLTSRAA